MFVLHETRETHKTKRNQTKSNKTVALKEIVCSAKKKKKKIIDYTILWIRPSRIEYIENIRKTMIQNHLSIYSIFVNHKRSLVLQIYF